MKSPIQQILEILENYDIEIISFGLAPRPWGFCFEVNSDDKETLYEAQRLDELLFILSDKEESELRKHVF